jgi:hypothetical protein
MLCKCKALSSKPNPTKTKCCIFIGNLPLTKHIRTGKRYRIKEKEFKEGLF